MIAADFDHKTNSALTQLGRVLRGTCHESDPSNESTLRTSRGGSYCGQNPAEHVDHVIPRVRGGDLTPENLTGACAWCNLSKGARVAPVNPPPNYVGDWPPPHWPARMLNWWQSTYGGM
ncbi:MAG: HNH endonuclease signature motif containing protein [Aeromicrobium sp.]